MQVASPAIVIVGTNHEYAPVDVRERLAFAGDRLTDGLHALREILPEALILSTCNRTEIYAAADQPDVVRNALFGFITRYHHVPETSLRDLAYVHEGEDAVNHLFRVASGLDSMILGEPQILTQIRDALDSARSERTVGPVLQRLALDALRVGKRARTETDIARNRVSIAHAAVDLAERELEGLDGMPVTIVGAGKMASLAAKLLRARGAGSIRIVNRTHANAQKIADAVGGTALPLDALPEALSESMLVIVAALADDPIVTNDSLRARTAPILIIDLAVPRLVDQSVAELPLVSVRDVDALDAIHEVYRREYASEVQKVEQIVSTSQSDYLAWLESRQGVEAIAAIRQRGEQIRDAELEKALRKLQHLSERDRNVIRALASGIANKFVHQPIQALRTSDGDDERATIVRAFGAE